MFEVLLMLTNGPQSGRRLTLGANHRATIGAGERADFQILFDDRVSERHAMVQTDAASCLIRDLDSDAGTFVNGERVTAAPLQNGDKVRIGGTEFRVNVQGAAAVTQFVARDLKGGGAPAAKPGQVQYRTEAAASGLTKHLGRLDQLGGAEAVQLLARALPLVLVVNRAMAGLQPPEGGPPPVYLCDWYPEEVAAECSPVILDAATDASWPATVAAAWGKNALVAFYTRQPLPEFVAWLRAQARPSEEGAAGVGYPLVLGAMLTSMNDGFPAEFMKPVEAVLMEGKQPPEHWQLYSKQPLDALLQKLGLAQEVPPPPTEGAAPASGGPPAASAPPSGAATPKPSGPPKLPWQ